MTRTWDRLYSGVMSNLGLGLQFRRKLYLKKKSVSAVVKVYSVSYCSVNAIHSAVTLTFVSSVTIPVRVDPLESSGSSSKGSSERQQGRGRGRGRGRGMANTTGKERTVKPGLQSEGNIIIHCNKLVILTIEWLPGLWTS